MITIHNDSSFHLKLKDTLTMNVPIKDTYKNEKVI